jgi:glycosyltransferase involved in cell wall biosynthesis
VQGPALLLTVVVISRDDPDGLRRTLRSIAQQSVPDIEVVVVARGSSMSAAGEPLPVQSTWIEQQADGISAAFNDGLARARGTWVNFLNGGDRYADSMVLQRMRARLESAGPAIVAARAQDARSGVRIPRDRSFAARNLELVSHQASFFRRELFGRLGPYSPDFRIRMDFEWMLRVPAGTPAAWVDEFIVDFEGGGISSTRPVASCLEEYRALRRHRRGALRIARLLAFYLPLRVGRQVLRRLGVPGFRSRTDAKADHAAG